MGRQTQIDQDFFKWYRRFETRKDRESNKLFLKNRSRSE